MKTSPIMLRAQSCSAAVLAIASVFSATAAAQTVRFEHLTVQEGLSQDIVSAIAQDEEGFLWCGTEDGLNRYDGYSVTVFKHDEHDSTSLISNDIACILPDHRGHVWIGTSGGPEMFDLQSQTFHHYTLSDRPGGISTNALCFDKDSTLWAGTGAGLYRFSHDAFVRVSEVGRPERKPVWRVFADSTLLWVIDTTGLHCEERVGAQIREIPLPSGIRFLRGRPVSYVMRDAKRNLWICMGSDGIYRCDPSLMRTEHFAASPGDPEAIRDRAVRTAVEDHDGALWFGTMSGLERFEPAMHGFVHYPCLPPGKAGSGLLGGRVYALFVDRTGTLWVGTYRGGLNSFARSRLKFHLFSPPEQNAEPDIFAVGESPDGEKVAGTTDGLFSLNEAHPQTQWNPYAATHGKTVFSTVTTREGELWAGLEGAVVRAGGKHTSSAIVRIPMVNPVHCLFEDVDGVLWAGTEIGGLYRIDRSRLTAERWSPSDAPRGTGVWSMFVDHLQRLWIGTWANDVCFRLDAGRKQLRRYGPLRSSDAYLKNPSIRAFREDSFGTMWLASWGDGIYCLDSLDHVIRHLSESDGLPSNFVKSLEFDRHATLWIGTERGLVHYDPSAGTFKTFTQLDGLPSNFFYSGASHVCADGTLIFGTNNGMVAFNPDSLPQNTTVPQVTITGFRIFDRPVPHKLWASEGNGFTLRYDQNFFAFEYGAMDFTTPQRNHYAYMLLGFDRDWIQAGTRRYASYTHLDPGTYTFRVMASNSDGIWNTAGASMTIVVTPPFWSAWWFRACIVAVLLSAGYGFYRVRLARVLAIERLRSRIARDLHDDIGTNLSAMVLASQLAGRQELPSQGREFFASIRSLALETQEQMRTIVWMLNPRNDSSAMLVSRMKDEAARVLNAVPHTFTAPVAGLPAPLDLETKRHLFLIYKEGLNNIARHSSASTADIALLCHEKVLELRVSDNGRGFDVGSRSNGNGIDNMKARAQQIGATLIIESALGNGTRLDVKIPLKR